MSDELIQKLKDAGYEGVPDLLGLIIACGDHFDGLRKHVGGWDATSAVRYYEGSGVSSFVARRHTNPVEAVAELWLMIHNKKVTQ